MLILLPVSSKYQFSVIFSISQDIINHGEGALCSKHYSVRWGLPNLYDFSALIMGC